MYDSFLEPCMYIFIFIRKFHEHVSRTGNIKYAVVEYSCFSYFWWLVELPKWLKWGYTWMSVSILIDLGVVWWRGTCMFKCRKVITLECWNSTNDGSVCLKPHRNLFLFYIFCCLISWIRWIYKFKRGKIQLLFSLNMIKQAKHRLTCSPMGF